MKKIIVLTALSAGLVVPMAAMAGPLVTSAQIEHFDFATLSESTVLTFNGFDANLGTLNSVHFEWSTDKTLNGEALNTLGTPTSIGDPTAVVSTSTTTFTGTGIASDLSDIDVLTTTGFVGTIAPSVVTVGPNGFQFTTTSIGSVASHTTGGVCLSNDSSCGVGSTNLSAYIGGLLTFNMSVVNTSHIDGSLNGIFVTNNGTASGDVSIFYDYTVPITPPGNNVPEASTVSLMGLGLSLFALQGLARRRKRVIR